MTNRPGAASRQRARSASVSSKPSTIHNHDNQRRPMTSTTRSNSVRSRAGPRSQPTIMSEADFRRLPTSIQRKCFSPLERLKIQQAAHVVVDPTFVPRSLSSHSNSLKQPPNGSYRIPKSLLKRPQSTCTESLVSEAEAQWFLSLPEKIRRQHFSREERILLAGGLNDSEVDLSDDGLVTLDTPVETAVAVPIIPIHVKGKQSFSEPSHSDRHSEPIKSFDDSATMSCFDDSSVRPRPRRPSFRSRLSTSRPSTAIFRNSTSSTPPMSPVLPFQHNRTRSAITNAVRPSNDSAIRAFDPGAVHYQNPEARNKLRQYLASPQKFDEAVEFGFPSSPPVTTPEFNQNKSHFRSISSNDAQTFLRDDIISFIDRYDEDSEEDNSEVELESPVTPGDANDDVFRSGDSHPLFSSLDSKDLPPLDFKFRQRSFPQDPMANREMTLRMTLTRPDLRAPEEELYGWQDTSHDDPLALEELPPATDDDTGAYGPFANKGNRNSGMLRRLFSMVKKERRS